MAFIAHTISAETDIAAINFLAVSGLTKSQLETIVDRANIETKGIHSLPLVAQRYVPISPYEALMECVNKLRVERLVDMCVDGCADEALKLWAKFLDGYNFYLGIKVASDYVRLGRRVDFTVQGPVEAYLGWVAKEMNSAMGGDPYKGPWAAVVSYHHAGNQRGDDGGKVIRVDLGRSNRGVGEIYHRLADQILFSGQKGEVGFLTPAAQLG
ncbi:hypothetical protein HYV82_05330 [Candidatus Woesearchaeota archaeon]|nr:hypothetical protein [Candidatus Woesearchaeota archaeon]